MTTIVKTETEKVGAFRQVLHFDRGGYTLFADTSKEAGGTATAPGPHDLFDASLAACKAFTAHSYAKMKGFPLERVTATIDRDDSKEKEGHYALTVTLELLGPLTGEQRERLLDVLSRCPVHKLMTTTEISITTRVA